MNWRIKLFETNNIIKTPVRAEPVEASERIDRSQNQPARFLRQAQDERTALGSFIAWNCIVMVTLGSCQLINGHHCPHFGKCLLEHSQAQNGDVQKTAENDAAQPAVVVPESFGKTHFIVGASSEQVKQELGAAPTDAQDSHLLQQVQPNESFSAQALFSPDDGLETKLIELIGQEQDSMKIAVFLFTNGNIAQALVDAQKRGIKIEIVTDASCLQDKFNKIAALHDAGINIHVYKPDSVTLLGNRMHHKYIIFGKNKEGKRWLWFGSFNLTKSADLYNQEGVIVLDNNQLIEQFDKQFDVLKTRCLSYKQALAPSATKVAQRLSRSIKRGAKKIRGTRIIA